MPKEWTCPSCGQVHRYQSPRAHCTHCGTIVWIGERVTQLHGRDPLEIERKRHVDQQIDGVHQLMEDQA